MKRFLCLLFVLALLFSASAFADDLDVVGCWAQYSVLTTGAPSMSMLYLAEDHTCYYVTQQFRPDEAGFGRTYIGSWEFQIDGTLFVKIGNNAKLNLRFTSSGDIALDTLTMDVYVNITPFNLSK